MLLLFCSESLDKKFALSPAIMHLFLIQFLTVEWYRLLQQTFWFISYPEKVNNIMENYAQLRKCLAWLSLSIDIEI